MAKCNQEPPEGFQFMGCDESGYSAMKILQEHFKGSLIEHFNGRYELEYSSNGILGSVRSAKRNKAFKKLIERLRADADFIEQNMIHDESANQG